MFLRWSVLSGPVHQRYPAGTRPEVPDTSARRRTEEPDAEAGHHHRTPGMSPVKPAKKPIRGNPVSRLEVTHALLEQKPIPFRERLAVQRPRPFKISAIDGFPATESRGHSDSCGSRGEFQGFELSGIRYCSFLRVVWPPNSLRGINNGKIQGAKMLARGRS